MKICSLPTHLVSARAARATLLPGMCLSERRIDGADLTFRFPRSWLAQWCDVANAMDRLTLQLHGRRDDVGVCGLSLSPARPDPPRGSPSGIGMSDRRLIVDEKHADRIPRRYRLRLKSSFFGRGTTRIF